jgi:hypothetical protein
MADRELIAAILTAGMLPTMEIPQSRAQGKGTPMITTGCVRIMSMTMLALNFDRS